jgi:hypothetical protein
MKREKRPLTPAEAYEGIVSAGLYKFKAKHPTAIVASQIRRHCRDIDLPKGGGKKYFEAQGQNRYSRLDDPA